MIRREQVKLEIDSLQEVYLNLLYRIIQVLKFLQGSDQSAAEVSDLNPLQNTVIFEDDLISPIEVNWDANPRSSLVFEGDWVAPIEAKLTSGEGDRHKQIQGASMMFKEIRSEVTISSPALVGLSIREAIEEGRRF